LPDEVTSMLVNSGNEWGMTTRCFEQAQTIGASTAPNKALLVDGKLGSESTNMTTRNGEAPCFTVTTSHNQRDMRAVLVNESSTFEMRAADAPSAARVASERNLRQKAILPHRVVAMTPRCLARFQSFPDSYELPDKRTLAAKVIGNMVPPLLMQRIAENMLEAFAWKGRC
jgi:site-specific DNA-cytosine methylase